MHVLFCLSFLLPLLLAFDENERLAAPGKDTKKDAKDPKKKIRKGTLKFPGAVDMLKNNDYFDNKTIHPPLEEIDTEPKKNIDEKVKELEQDR